MYNKIGRMLVFQWTGGPSVTVCDRKFCPCDSRNEWFIGFTTAVYHYAVKASDPRLHNFRQPEPCPFKKLLCLLAHLPVSGKKSPEAGDILNTFQSVFLKLDATRLSEVNRHLLRASRWSSKSRHKFPGVFAEQQIVR